MPFSPIWKASCNNLSLGLPRISAILRKGYGSEGLRLLEEEFSTVRQWDLCTVLQDAGMVAFYEKNGYHQTHIEPEKEGMDMVYMKKLIEK